MSKAALWALHGHGPLGGTAYVHSVVNLSKFRFGMKIHNIYDAMNGPPIRGSPPLRTWGACDRLRRSPATGHLIVTIFNPS